MQLWSQRETSRATILPEKPVGRSQGTRYSLELMTLAMLRGTEKVADGENFARGGINRTSRRFSGSLRSDEAPDMGHFRPLSKEVTGYKDSMADGGVRCELLSTSNSLIIRENTGNFRDFGRLGVELGPNKSCLLSGF